MILIFGSLIRFLTTSFRLPFQLMNMLGLVVLLWDWYRNRNTPKSDIQTVFTSVLVGPSRRFQNFS